mgnify:CR=1 FL=1|jgi:hypothetical protein
MNFKNLRNRTYLYITLICVSCNLNRSEKLNKKYNIVGEILKLKDITLKEINSGSKNIDSVYSKKEKFTINSNKIKSEGLYF